MNISPMMNDAMLTAEMAATFLVDRAIIDGPADTYTIPGTEVHKPRIRVTLVGWPDGTAREIECWLPLRSQDLLLFGTLWGPDTEAWKGKHLKITTAVIGSQVRMKLQPGTPPAAGKK